MADQKEAGPFQRASGLLLHITSLPGPHGIGDLGKDAYAFVDFLASAGQSLWQILPLVQPGIGESPYTALSAFAGNPLLISLDNLVNDGLLGEDDLAGMPYFPADRVDFPAVRAYKYPLLRKAYETFSQTEGNGHRVDFENFRKENSFWLDDYSLFMALKSAQNGASWTDWDKGLCSREEPALLQAQVSLKDEIGYWAFLQYVFARQWFALKNFANSRGIRLVGDIPIFVAHDSADVWAHQELFALDAQGHPVVVTGVPPDYFSETGQRWGNPHYNWDVLATTKFQWWVDRLRETLRLIDIVRIDHFRGFEACWEIPAYEDTAVRGCWVNGPGESLFQAVESVLGHHLPVIVEDLGLITPAVVQLREKLGYPAMKVLQFAFSGESDNPHLPHNHERNFVVYTATHDNDTTVGWWAGLNEYYRTIVGNYMGLYINDVAWSLIRLAESSVANLCIIPLQDVLGLGSESRMNHPGSSGGNWAWRYHNDQLADWHRDRLRELAGLFGRLPVESGTK